MATKKECDRCGKQWTPSTNNKYNDEDERWGTEPDTELSIVSVTIPDQRKGSAYSKTFELCRFCATEVKKLVTEKPPQPA